MPEPLPQPLDPFNLEGSDSKQLQVGKLHQWAKDNLRNIYLADRILGEIYQCAVDTCSLLSLKFQTTTHPLIQVSLKETRVVTNFAKQIYLANVIFETRLATYSPSRVD